MSKIKEFKWIILIIIAILGGVFYWYEYRPAQIKKFCNERALKSKNLSGGFAVFSDSCFKKSYDECYQICLREKGL